MTTGNSNELMQEGIRQVREGRTEGAYATFKQVVSRDPRNEFAWIWVSVTSQDRAEKRAALQTALQINPNNQHAREALRVLDAEERNSIPARSTENVAPPPFDFVSPPRSAPYNPRIGEGEVITSPRPVEPQARLTSVPPPTRQFRNRPAKDIPAAKDTQMVSRPSRGRAFRQRLQITAFFIVAILIALIAAYVISQSQREQNNQQAVTGPLPTAILTETAPTEATTAAATTTLADTPIVTPGLSAPPVVGSPLAGGSPVGQATVASGTPGAPTPGPTTVNGTNTQPTPASTSEAAQVARAIGTARDSLAAGDYKAAIAAYQQAVATSPRNVSANLGLGDVYLKASPADIPAGTDRYAEAVKAFRVVTTQSPNWSGGFARLGEALSAQGDTKAAIQAYSKSLELDPNGPERWLALATLYDRDNQPEQARFARDRATNLSAAAIPTTTAPPTTTVAPTTAAPTTAAPGPGPTATPKR